MSTPDPRRGDEPGDPITPATGTADNDLDENAPEHDSKNPELEDAPGPDEAGPAPMGDDDDLISGQYGPPGDYGQD